MTLEYYNYDKLMSYNGVYNFLVGGRGLGKTYGAKEKSIRAALTKGHQFIYLRRYKSELAASRNTFYADVEHLFPDWDFAIKGQSAVAAPVSTRDDKKRAWIVMGYFVALSTSQTQKSVAFPKVRTIIFDEFIIEKGAIRYLPDESTVFNNFFSTVDRYKDKTRVFFLANSVSIMNPYFIEYEIRPDESNEILVTADGFIVCHFPESEAFASGVYETKFGKFIKDTDYASYAIGNTFSDDHDALIADKDSRARYLFSLECKNGTFSVWNYKDGYHITDRLPKNQLKFTLLPDRMAEDKTLMTFKDKPLGSLRTAFRQASITFNKPSTRNTFAEVFKN